MPSNDVIMMLIESRSCRTLLRSYCSRASNYTGWVVGWRSKGLLDDWFIGVERAALWAIRRFITVRCWELRWWCEKRENVGMCKHPSYSRLDDLVHQCFLNDLSLQLLDLKSCWTIFLNYSTVSLLKHAGQPLQTQSRLFWMHLLDSSECTPLPVYSCRNLLSCYTTALQNIYMP